MNKYARRVDGNHAEIKRALRAVGCDVFDASRFGGSFPDLVVGRNNRSMLLEVKDGSKPPSARKPSEGQESFAANWRGHYALVTSVEEAIDAVEEATCR